MHTLSAKKKNHKADRTSSKAHLKAFDRGSFASVSQSLVYPRYYQIISCSLSMSKVFKNIQSVPAYRLEDQMYEYSQ